MGSNEVLDQYKVGSRLGLSNSQTDDIVDDLNMGLIKKIRDSKILMTIDGKKKLKMHIDFLLISLLVEPIVNAEPRYLKLCFIIL
ncbi:MAG: hypothetical protein QN721_09510 [Nitrososphaeraceae archaeon]|nr:hypothetical protein [Nitrososphaeraceae archaeon]